jgi:hypothetical protein
MFWGFDLFFSLQTKLRKQQMFIMDYVKICKNSSFLSSEHCSEQVLQDLSAREPCFKKIMKIAILIGKETFVFYRLKSTFLGNLKTGACFLLFLFFFRQTP